VSDMREWRSIVDVQTNWWETFFEGVAVTMWLQAVPAEHTQREADRLARLLAAAPGAEILDVPCGAGRLALPLAERGYRLTGIDWSSEFLGHARSRDALQQVTWEQGDMRNLPWRERFDGVFCMGNSFGYLDDEGNRAFLRSVRDALKPGGRFVLETPMVLENLLNYLQPRPWWKAGDVYLLVENQYDPASARLNIEYTFVSNGRVDVRRGSHRTYSYRELVELLTAAGFGVEAAEPWTRDAHAVSFVATRV
jgi:2-polyprenyl-3-methyl-5-hydroxy-6-metoxy-1,4-benzoquinol methylase